MKRRDFLAMVASAALWPLPGTAETAKVPTIGVLVVESPASQRFWRLFQEDMRELDYVEGKNVRYEFRSDGGQGSRLPALAAELVGLKVDLIVAWFTPAALAARQATRQIPIVMALVGNPVENGLVESLARPGGNVTGMAALGAELAGKCVDLVRELVPSAHRIAALVNAPDPFTKPFLRQIQLNGEASGIAIEPIMIQSTAELDPAFIAMEKERPDAAIVQPSLPIKRVAELAIKSRIPAISFIRDFANEGGLMGYGSEPTRTGRPRSTSTRF